MNNIYNITFKDIKGPVTYLRLSTGPAVADPPPPAMTGTAARHPPAVTGTAARHLPPQKATAKRLCYRCRLYGHTVRQCLDPPPPAVTATAAHHPPAETGTAARHLPPRKATTKRLCYRCRRYGHTVRQCLELRDPVSSNSDIEVLGIHLNQTHHTIDRRGSVPNTAVEISRHRVSRSSGDHRVVSEEFRDGSSTQLLTVLRPRVQAPGGRSRFTAPAASSTQSRRRHNDQR